MKSDLDLAQTLGVKAGNDLKMAEIGLEHAAPLDTVAFHLQQNAEKMLKALLASRRIDYPRTPRPPGVLERATQREASDCCATREHPDLYQPPEPKQ